MSRADQKSGAWSPRRLVQPRRFYGQVARGANNMTATPMRQIAAPIDSATATFDRFTEQGLTVVIDDRCTHRPATMNEVGLS